MASTEVPNDIVLFHYPFSPYARKVVWYLTLRGIPYAQCIQPPVLPRADLNALGIQYRRIPLMAIGRDLYCDTRCIISQLETRFANSSYPPLSSSDSKPLEVLLDSFTTEGGVFARAAQLMPLNLPVLNDQKFLKDREEMMGRSWQKEDIARQRPEAMASMRKIFDVLETVLQDGRQWIGGTDKVTLADVHAVWPIDWLFELKGLDEKLFSDKIYPNTYAWVQRFRGALKAAKASAGKPVSLKGPAAVKHILSASYTDDCVVELDDPFGLKEGDSVEIWPIDSGSNHKDQGRLVKLTKDEVAIAVQTKSGGQEVRLHAPRWGFRVRAIGAKL